MEIEQIHIDYASGQHEFEIVVKDEGEAIGRLCYSLFDDTPYVKMIEAYRPRERVGTSLILALQEFYPETPIQFGYLTEDGAALLESLQWSSVPNEERISAARQVEEVRARLHLYRDKAGKLAGATEAEREAFISESADWNDLHDLEERLSHIVNNTPAEFKFAVGGKPASSSPCTAPRCPAIK